MKVLTKVIAVAMLFCCASQAQAKHPIIDGKGRAALAALGATGGAAIFAFIGAIIGAYLGKEPCMYPPDLSGALEFLIGAGVGATTGAILFGGLTASCLSKYNPSARKKLLKELIVALQAGDATDRPGLEKLLDDKDNAEGLASRLDKYFPGIHEKKIQILEDIGLRIQEQLDALPVADELEGVE